MDDSATVFLDASGGTTASASVTVTITDDDLPTQTPGPPGVPTLVSRTSTSLTLQTTAPTTGGAPSTYRWRYSTNSAVTNSDPQVTSSGPTVTISNLSANTNYWIDVRAENSAGQSSYTADLATSTTADTPTLPAAAAPTVTIGAVTTVPENTTQALTASVSGGTYDSLSYAWTVVSGGGSLSGSGSSVTYTPANVTSNTTVQVQCTVTARGTGTVAKSGTSATASDTESFTVNYVPAAPGVPTNVSITFYYDPGGQDGDHATLSWNAPSSGDSVTQYRVGFFDSYSSNWVTPYPSTTTGTTASYSFDRSGIDITKGRVRAENSSGNSDWAESS